MTHGRKPDGSRRTLSATVNGTRADAEAEARRLSRVMGLSPNYGSGLTLDAYVYGVFLPSRSDLKRKTLMGYESDYRLHIAPRLGSCRLEDVTRPMVQSWLADQPPKSARNYMRTLSAILGGAVDDGVLDSPVPLSRLRFPRRPHDDVPTVWDAPTVAECLERLEGSPLFPLWLVMVGAGLSRSEACALEWSDVSDVDGMAVVAVSKALTATDGLMGPKNPYRYRTVPVVAPFGPMLLSMRGEGRIWPHGPEWAGKLWRDAFKPGGAIEGLPYVTINRMRATHETLLQRAGVVDTLNARIHGRSNVQTGYAHYLAPGLDSMADAAASVDKLLNGLNF